MTNKYPIDPIKKGDGVFLEHTVHIKSGDSTFSGFNHAGLTVPIRLGTNLGTD